MSTRAGLVAVFLWLTLVAAAWWHGAHTARSAATTYATAVFGGQDSAHLAFRDEVMWDRFWNVTDYAAAASALVALIIGLSCGHKGGALIVVIVTFLAALTTAVLLLALWAGQILLVFQRINYQLLR